MPGELGDAGIIFISISLSLVPYQMQIILVICRLVTCWVVAAPPSPADLPVAAVAPASPAGCRFAPRASDGSAHRRRFTGRPFSRDGRGPSSASAPALKSIPLQTRSKKSWPGPRLKCAGETIFFPEYWQGQAL